MRGFPALAGSAYLTCATVHLNYHGAAVTADLLLDARHPGTAPAPFPYATALSPSLENVEQPDWSLATFSARRVGPAWLVVQSAGSLAQRLAILGSWARAWTDTAVRRRVRVRGRRAARKAPGRAGQAASRWGSSSCSCVAK